MCPCRRRISASCAASGGKCYRFIKFLALTPIGRLAASDHAMNAKDEMRRLYDDFRQLIDAAGINTPAWDELGRHMPVV